MTILKKKGVIVNESNRGNGNIFKECNVVARALRYFKKHMAELLGIGIASLNKMENGEMPKRLGVEIVFKIYDVFKILPKNQFALELWNLNSDESIRKSKKQRA